LRITKMDGKGRIVIPKDIRLRLGLKEGVRLRVKVEGGKLVMEPVSSVSRKYYGAFKPRRWPEDLDDFIVEVLRKWEEEGT
jgi:AbrB family looped-hinge helix DNA binding protein